MMLSLALVHLVLEVVLKDKSSVLCLVLGLKDLVLGPFLGLEVCVFVNITIFIEVNKKV